MWVFFLLSFLPVETFDLSKISTQKITVEDFSDIGQIKSYIKLETKPTCLLGSVNKVIFDEPRKRLLVADFDSTSSIQVFTLSGRHMFSIRRIGDGPGEYRDFADFTILPDGTIILSSNGKLIKYSATGVFIKELITLDKFIPDHIDSLNGQIIVNTLRLRNNQYKYDVFSLTSSLGVENNFHPHDKRKDIYIYSSLSNLSIMKNQIWVSDMYQPKLSVYDTKGKLVDSYSLPQMNKEILDDQWISTPFNENNRTKIKDFMHRFYHMIPYGDSIILFDFHKRPDRLWRMMRLDPRKKLTIYEGYHLLNRAYLKKSLVFFWLAGNFKDQIIGVLESEETDDVPFEKYPALKDLHIDPDENQVLILFSLK